MKDKNGHGQSNKPGDGMRAGFPRYGYRARIEAQRRLLTDVYPGANGAFTLYDDDGQSLGYRDATGGKTTWMHFRWEEVKRRLTIEPDPRREL